MSALERFKSREDWYSPRLDARITMARWGHFGTPVLVFPTAGGDAEEIERMHLVGAVANYVEAGRIKVYSVDSLAGRAWMQSELPRAQVCLTQDRFDACIAEEVVPAIYRDCGGAKLDIVTAGCSLGAFNAVATTCRHPDLFSLAIAMSGTYDLTRFLDGYFDEHFYFSSPMHWLSRLDAGPQLVRLRERFVLMAYAGGRWEDPTETIRMAEVLGAKGIANRVDPWGPEWDHDWPTWRAMLPAYIEEFVQP